MNIEPHPLPAWAWHVAALIDVENRRFMPHFEALPHESRTVPSLITLDLCSTRPELLKNQEQSQGPCCLEMGRLCPLLSNPVTFFFIRSSRLSTVIAVFIIFTDASQKSAHDFTIGLNRGMGWHSRYIKLCVTSWPSHLLLEWETIVLVGFHLLSLVKEQPLKLCVAQFSIFGGYMIE